VDRAVFFRALLKFADSFLSDPGVRIVEVIVNNAVVLPQFDIIKAAGRPRRQ
jgi:hypothetical protein